MRLSSVANSCCGAKQWLLSPCILVVAGVPLLLSCDKQFDSHSEEAHGFPEYVLVAGTELEYVEIGNLTRSPRVAKGDIRGDIVVFLNGNPVARLVNSCGFTVTPFLREGINTLRLKGDSPQQFKVGLTVSRKVTAEMYSFEDVCVKEIQPTECESVDVTIPFLVTRAAQNPVLGMHSPGDRDAVEAELKEWLEGINQLIRFKRYGELYKAVFQYKDLWQADNYGGFAEQRQRDTWLERQRENWLNQTAQTGFILFTINIPDIRFVYGPNLILAYDQSVREDDLNRQGVIMAAFGSGRKHSIVDYLRLATVDGEWKAY